MIYIQKMDAPDFFTTETADFNADTNWKELHCKPNLRQHLRQEQQQLCAYCESKLEDNNSHIEHIEPQEKNPQRRFDYNNLIVSCNGGEACCKLAIHYLLNTKLPFIKALFILCPSLSHLLEFSSTPNFAIASNTISSLVNEGESLLLG